MKKIFSAFLAAAGLFAATSCTEFLTTNSSSVVDVDFVFSNMETARASMYGVYEAWRTAANSNVFGDGLYYALDICGSDIERHPEAFSNQPGRHYPECLYQNGTFAKEYGLLSYQSETGSAYTHLFSLIGSANSVINAMQSANNFGEEMAKEEPTEFTQLYGEAMVARAIAYRELCKYYGDVPFATKSGESASGLSPRDSIYDCIIKDLETVIPHMFRVGENATMEKNIFSRTFAEGMIVRICLDAAGYQTRRMDLPNFYKDGEGNILEFEQKGQPNANADNAIYARRKDYLDYYQKAKKYCEDLLANPGNGVVFHSSDPRAIGAKGQQFGNPYQYFFQQMNDLTYADESIYEYAMTQGTGNDARPYSYGRVSSGGGSNAFPCKDYGQGRINPAYFYGMFDPNDMRRDVSVCVTGSDGAGAEVLIPFTPNSKAAGGGLTLNKWDECRMSSPYIQKQRTSGINGPYMRISEMYLSYAEICAVLGQEGPAKEYLKLVRERSFPAGKANTDKFIASCGSLLRAVIEERGFEFAGEGDRRWTLIRTGFLPEAIKNIKDMTKNMIDGLASQGYYEFANGNVISSYLWTKTVDAKALYGYRLTTQCPDESDPVLFPGWRGQNDDWAGLAASKGVSVSSLKAGDLTNLAIKGLFNRISDEEAAALEADGYKKVDWGNTLVEKSDEYLKYLFYDYDYVSAPIYLWPYTPNAVSTGGFTNGYSFKNE